MATNGGIIGKSNKASFGKCTVTTKTSSGNITTQSGTRVIESLVIAGGGSGGNDSGGGDVSSSTDPEDNSNAAGGSNNDGSAGNNGDNNNNNNNNNDNNNDDGDNTNGDNSDLPISCARFTSCEECSSQPCSWVETDYGVYVSTTCLSNANNIGVSCSEATDNMQR